MLRRSAIHGASAAAHRSYLLRAQLSAQNQHQTNPGQSDVIGSNQRPKELRGVNQGRPQHLVYVMDENLRRDFLVALLESMHRIMLEDLGGQRVRDK